MKTFFLLFASAVVSVAAGCDRWSPGRRAAEQAVVEFHQLVEAGKSAEIYAAADPRLKAQASKKAFVEYIEKVRKKLGQAKRSRNLSCNVVTCNGVTTTIVQQETTFKRSSGEMTNARETFTFLVSGPKAALVTYSVALESLR